MKFVGFPLIFPDHRVLSKTMDADFARDKNVEKCSFVRNREMNCLFVSRISKKRRCFLLIYRTFFNIERPSNLLNRDRFATFLKRHVRVFCVKFRFEYINSGNELFVNIVH